jgi:hypothetical protein
VHARTLCPLNFAAHSESVSKKNESACLDQVQNRNANKNMQTYFVFETTIFLTV